MKGLSAIAACLLSGSVYAQTDSQITVLGVTLPGADYNAARAYLENVASHTYWYTWPTHTSVRLANNGLPVPMPAPMTSTGFGTDEEQLDRAHADLATHDFRLDADVVLYFSAGFSNPDAFACGLAPNIVWTGDGSSPPGDRFQPGPDGLDLRGAEDSFEAIVATVCAGIGPEVAIHELGHLLGAGHEVAHSPSVDWYLRPDSHAAVNYYEWEMGPYRTIVSTGDLEQMFYPFWSSWDLGSPDSPNNTPGDNNLGTVRTTGKSVANYRVATQPPPPPPPTEPPPPMPPGCTLQTPSGAVAQLRNQCDPYPQTSYDFWWFDTCPGATSHYQVEHSQPPGSPYATTGSTLFQHTPIYIQGAPALIRVLACDGPVCSDPSNEVFITPQC